MMALPSDLGGHVDQQSLTIQELQDSLGKDVVPSSVEQFSPELICTKVIGKALNEHMVKMWSHYTGGKWSLCLDQCEILQDITWEQLNTGHWKDIDITWRYVYTVVSWAKALCQFAVGRNSQLKRAIKTCDMGLLMGAPIRDNILTKLVSKFQQMYSECSMADATEHERPIKKLKVDNLPIIEMPVGVLSNPSLEYFRAEHMLPEVPVVIQQAMEYWPAMGERKWSLDYIKKRAGCRTVPIEVGSKYTEDEWSQSLMTIEEFIEKYIETPTSHKGYLAQHQLFQQVPELQKDIYIPSYCGLGTDTDVDINAWFGPEGTVSPLHQDPKHNLLSQVVGEKYIRLYSTQHTDMVYPHSSRLFSNTSQVDVEHPDLDQFPNFAKAPYTECLLKPGDMLYIPPKYWHYVRSLSVSFSVSFWWE